MYVIFHLVVDRSNTSLHDTYVILTLCDIGVTSCNSCTQPSLNIWHFVNWHLTLIHTFISTCLSHFLYFATHCQLFLFPACIICLVPFKLMQALILLWFIIWWQKWSHAVCSLSRPFTLAGLSQFWCDDLVLTSSCIFDFSTNY